MASEAVPEPPGLSTRRMIARTPSSSPAWRSPRTIVSEPARLPPNGLDWLSPGHDLPHRVHERHLRPPVEAEPAPGPHVARRAHAVPRPECGPRPGPGRAARRRARPPSPRARRKGPRSTSARTSSGVRPRPSAIARTYWSKRLPTSASICSRCGSVKPDLRELVRRVLVLADALELRLDPELVEGALVERHLRGEARHVEHRGRGGRDLRAARGEEVLLVARELEVRPGGLAAAAEAHERVAQLLDAGPAGVHRAHAQQEPLHRRVPPPRDPRPRPAPASTAGGSRRAR